MSEPRFVDVLVPVGENLDRTFTYHVPSHLEKIQIGDPVLVPFRKATASGFVVSFTQNPNIPTKPVLEKNPKLAALSQEILSMSRWIAERYVSPWWEALQGFVFSKNGTLETDVSAANFPLQEISLTQEQQCASAKIQKALHAQRHEIFLLHGITGSGKTEVYLSCTASALKTGKEVLILVPEIPLSFHLAKRFQAIFGNRVAVLHSALTEKEKRIEQHKLAEGTASIAVGPRTALFAPFRNLGLVIVDEEHDPSYKQESHPRYHTVTVAKEMAKRKNAVILLGSATPSLESYHLAEEKKITYLTLSTRYESRLLPRVEIVDLRQETDSSQKPLSTRLIQALSDTLNHGHQAILFMNRRGFSPLVLCPHCGHTFRCPHCSISLNFHLKEKLLQCHYCDYKNPAPTLCPQCQSHRLTYRGFGTERLEEKIRENFPQTKILRLDRDTTSKRGSTKAILEAFSNGESQILLGTQMVTKGFDFPRVSLVGIVSSDHLLHFPDFRASERTFQLLTQVAGRAGRGSVEGNVILQTYDPDHPTIRAAANQDYLAFYKEEIKIRQSALYPPFVSLANLILSCTDPLLLEGQAKILREFILGNFKEDKELILLGPSPCPFPKINKNYRWHLLLKSSRLETLAALGKEVHQWYARNGNRKIHLTIDIEPMRLL